MDFATQPTSAQRTNAARFPIASPNLLFSGAGLADTTRVIKAAIAAGSPVLVNVPVYANFQAANATNFVVGPPSTNETPSGIHALFAPRYDEQGLWVENSWGTGWGNRGWAVLTWDFVARYALEGIHDHGA